MGDGRCETTVRSDVVIARLDLSRSVAKLADQPKDKADEDACQQAARKGEVEAEARALDDDVTGQPAEPGNFRDQENDKSNSSEDHSKQDE